MTARQLATAFLVFACIVGPGCDKAPPPKGVSGGAGSAADSLFAGLSFEEAKAKAAKDGKLVMIDFYADWCGPCRMLDDTTWKDAKVREWLGAKTVCLKMNVDEQQALAKQFNVSSIPALVFVDGAGKEVKRLVGYRDAAAFLNETQSLAK